MTSNQSMSATCSLLLKEWKRSLNLTHLEETKLSGEIKALAQQFDRLSKRHIRITVFGRVGVGKSSLLNALIGKNIFATDIAHGFTRKAQGVIWEEPTNRFGIIELVDTPGIDEIAAKGRSRLASRVALHSD